MFGEWCKGLQYLLLSATEYIPSRTIIQFEGENGLLFSRNGKSCGMNISLTMNLLLDMGMYFEAGIQYIHNFIFFSRRERKKQGRRDERF